MLLFGRSLLVVQGAFQLELMRIAARPIPRLLVLVLLSRRPPSPIFSSFCHIYRLYSDGLRLSLVRICAALVVPGGRGGARLECHRKRCQKCRQKWPSNGQLLPTRGTPDYRVDVESTGLEQGGFKPSVEPLLNTADGDRH